MKTDFDIIVIGAGHAGNEAAAAAAKMGSKVLLITIDMTKIGQMSCNPAMGGIGKGQLIREIDALGGLSGIVSDLSAIQFKILNRSKGPAMWSPRTQNDRWLFAETWRKKLEEISNVSFWQDTVTRLILEKNKVRGVETNMGIKFYSSAVIITSGTFLNGIIHVGQNQTTGGRIGEKSSTGISEQLETVGIKKGRMKTGTPPRIDGRTIDFSSLEKQPGDEKPEKFSFWPETKPVENQLDCYLTYTNPKVHTILQEGFEQSPMFTGKIKGMGPRYCPSIEDKIVRFSEKKEHQLFLEPEGRNTVEYYLNGFSSSLPLEIQLKALKHIPGLENAKIFRPGYAIEYDFFFPTQLYPTLESKYIDNLFFAGQVNGTTGYEEAAAQGLMAGINAHLKIHEKDGLVLKRHEAYIGVLIDDLVYKGTEEPYRMFTSRAEFRITLRHNNADARLSPIGYQIGLLEKNKYQFFLKKKEKIEKVIGFVSETSIDPEAINPFLEKVGTAPINQKLKIKTLLSRPQISIVDLINFLPEIYTKIQRITENDNSVLEAAEVEIKYAGYLDREKMLVEKIQKLENLKLPPTLNYHALQALSTEARQKLSALKPTTLGEASRISGVSPSDISILMVHLGR
ncbi:MAG: tRNA uridine-5-carboxymethylaminomethyl(34) synthesis enzyme MnmG [Flavobacteriales bacterium]|nr:tRNA uridine-5-carboxymethylaminomethyl(34) synthesis enzyme MnmG [Flavobacteriales bacterium]